MSGRSDAELYEIGFQDGMYHAVNATGQTTSEERGDPPDKSPYYQGYTDGRAERRQ